MKTNATIRLTRTQYRALAETAKAAGIGLKVDTAEQMGCWGDFCLVASDLVSNALAHRSACLQRPCATLATSIDVAAFRSASRPEIDWGQLHDHEIYPFVLQHEIGHWVDNIDPFAVWAYPDLALRRRLESAAQLVNEVLADRFAWEQVRPGESLPLCESGKRMQEEAAAAFELLDQHVPRKRRQVSPLPAGQYASVPTKMLRDDRFRTFVGARVHPALTQPSSTRAAKRRAVRATQEVTYVQH